ncbi:MAG: PspC domain-containing protein [Propionibacteriaceae bacterium]|jgi:phage shock protein PspC (stress-responsive transcriptional regulator)|nr:PspC domain-containing protein [Propionibacteriaceae bacterium]
MSTNGSLARSRTNKVLAGVCGGVAEYAGWDAGVIRAIAAIACLFTAGTVLLIYVVLWIVLPEQGSSTTGVDAIIGAFRRQPPPTDLR